MSIVAAHAAEFYREVAESSKVWSIKDSGGFPAPFSTEGKRVMPFWSSESRALAVIRNVPAYKNFTPVSIEWTVFCHRWVPGLTNEGLLAGVNWSGTSASGFDLEPMDVQRNVEALHLGN